jgi:hypothetical protein
VEGNGNGKLKLLFSDSLDGGMTEITKYLRFYLLPLQYKAGLKKTTKTSE